MRYFCTYFDSRFLPRALALYSSLRLHSPGCRIFSLCFDGAAYDAVVSMKLDGMVPVSMAELEKDHPDLPAVKAGRSVAEYYLTCTPVLPLYLLEKFREVDILTYVDSDLYFFASPEAVFEVMGGASIAITPHRFAPNVVGGEKTGIFNDGWMSFRRGPDAEACLRWWKERCLEWCYDRSEEGKHAEQGYLNNWPALFKNVAVINNPGVNAAPWNLRNEVVGFENGAVTVGGRPLVFFHFSGLWQVNRWLYDTSLLDYRLRPSKLVREKIYKPYIRALAEAKEAAASGSSAAGRSAVGFHRPGFTLRRFLKSLYGRQLILTARGRVVS